MGKDLDLLNAVKNNDVGTVRKILGKILASKTKKTAKKYNVNVQDEDGFTALHHAALKGNTDITMALLDVQCNVNARDKKGMAPLHLASWAGKTEIGKLLVDARACVNICADSGDTPLHLACQHCNVGIAEVLLDSNVDSTVVNKNGESALDLACRFGHAQIVDMLLKSKDCHKLLSLYEENPKTADPPLHIACKTGREEIVIMLLDAGADINQKGANGTPLHEASLYGKTDVVKILLDNCADVNLPNDEGHIPLDLVVQFTSSRASQEIKDLLRDASKTKVVTAKAIHDYQNMYDPTCLSFKTGDMIEILDQNEKGRWKGKLISGKKEIVGYFPSTMVKISNTRKSARSGKVMSMNSGILPLGKYEMVTLPSVQGQSSPGRCSRPRMSSFGKPNGKSSSSPPVSPEKQTTDIQQPHTKRSRPNLIANGLEESKLFHKKQESLQYIEVSVDNQSPPPNSPGSDNGFRTQYAEVVLHSPVNEGSEDPPSLPEKSYKQEKKDNEIQRGKKDDGVWVKNPSDVPELPLKNSSLFKDNITRESNEMETEPNLEKDFVKRETENNMKDENENEMENASENEEDLMLTPNASSDLEKAIQNLDSNSPNTSGKERKRYEDMSLNSPHRESLQERETKREVQFSSRKLAFNEQELGGSPSRERKQMLAYENVQLHKHRPKDAVVNTMLISDIDQENGPNYVIVKQGVSPDPRDIAPFTKHRYENVPKGFECKEESAKEKTGGVDKSEQNYENMDGNGEFTSPGYVPMQGAGKVLLSKTDSYENVDIKSEEGPGSADYISMNNDVHTGSNRDYINIQLPASTKEIADHSLPGAPSGLTMNEYNCLYDWLETCKLAIYIDSFVQGGFDMTSVAGLTADDLTAINIIKTGHRKKLLSESSKLNLPKDAFPHKRPDDIMAWLRLIHLDQYTPQFIDNGFDDMDFVQDITIEDLVSIGITKPGHQRKIWLAVNALDLVNPEENREINPSRVALDKQDSNVERYLETDLDMVEENRLRERGGIEVKSTDIDSALSRLPADGASDVAIACEDVITEPDEHGNQSHKQTPKKTLDNALASLHIESLNDTRGSTPDLDSILDSLDNDSSSSPEKRTEAIQSQPSQDRRASGPFQMSFTRRARSSSKERMSADSGLLSRSFVKNQPEATADVNEMGKKSSAETTQSYYGRTDADLRQDDDTGGTPSEEAEFTLTSLGRHNTMGSIPSDSIGGSSFDNRSRGLSFDSKTPNKRPAPPVKPKTFKKPPPIAPKPPIPSPAKGRLKNLGDEKGESTKTELQDSETKDSCYSNNASPKKIPPPTLPKARNGSIRSQSTSSDDSIEAALEELQKRKHYEGRRKSFEKLKRKFTDSSSESGEQDVESNDLGTRSYSQQGLEGQIKDVFKRRSQEDILVDQNELKPLNPETTVRKDDVDTDEELLTDQQYTEDLMKDINSMLSDFSTEIETMFEDDHDKSTSV